ncbi:uncharacterized protein [Coffea arabica]|uniref:Aminotransferase class V domain-containing protein n=1 Tax=Coffea arabica TaxID=13443 RepID=A0A6P6T8X9_COFAR|nr:uncharacterized protein LOC113698684 [Coffea arabica]
MELEHPKMQESSLRGQKMKKQSAGLESSDAHSSKYHIGSFHELQKGIPRNESTEEKLQWIQSQIIGGNVEFGTPFGRRRLTYADHTATGRCLRYIEDYIINHVLPVYGNCHSSDSYVGCRMTKMTHEVAKYVKKCLGGGEEDAIIFCGSGSTAAIKRLQEVIGVAVPSIIREKVSNCLGNEEKWVVFVGPYEHHSNILSWRQSLAEVVEIGFDDNGLIDMEALRQQLESHKSRNCPMLGSFSACSNVSGIYSDTKAIARLLHQYGAFACFDFAASGPYVKIDMRSGESDGYDAVFLSPHKFLGGPGSPGILLMSKALYHLRSSAPSTSGGGTVHFVNGFSEQDTLYVKNVEEREEAGTPPIIQKIRATLAFWVKEYIGHNVIETMEHNYIQQTLERLLPNPNIKILGNVTEKRQAVLSFLIYSTTYSPSAEGNAQDNLDRNETSGLYLWRETGNKKGKPLHGPYISKLLSDLFGIQARGGCACAGPYGHMLLEIDRAQSLALRSAAERGYIGVKPGWTRVSFSYYMSKAEFEFILAAIEFLAIYGQRFLPLYHLNWETGDWSFMKKALKEAGEGYNCDFNGTSLANLIKDFNLGCNDSKENKDRETTEAGLECKYAKYLETAKHIAVMLPKFPTQRRIPEDIDPSLLSFRV